MRKVIGGKTYDTRTAKELGHDSYSYTSDFNHWHEGLYQTERGAYFIAGSGGALSKYAVSIGSGNCGGSWDIQLVSEEEARDWLERHGTAQEYEDAFTVELG